MMKPALKSYRKYYEDPISVTSGETVSWIQKESEWPGWTWCTHPTTGKSGWVPDAVLKKEDSNALILQDYSAAELDAKEGEMFLLLKEKSGWYWCRNKDGECGWLPIELFKIAAQVEQ